MTGDGGLASVDVANEDQGAGLTGLINLSDEFLVDLDSDVFDNLNFDLRLLGDTFSVALLLFALSVVVDLAGGGLLALLAALGGGHAEGRLLIGQVFLLVLFILLIISTILGSGGGAGAVVLLVLLLLELLLLLGADCLRVEPVDDLGRVHRVLGVILEHKDHLLLGELTRLGDNEEIG